MMKGAAAMFLADCHTHSLYSFDGRDTPEQMLAEAARQGLAALTLTDHYDLTPASCCHSIRGEQQWEAHLRRLAGNHGGTELLYGVELGQPQQNPAEARALLARHDFDFVIGSIHMLSDGRDIYSVEYRDIQVCRGVLDLYFQDMLKLLDFGEFDSLGHLDYPLRVMEGAWPEPSLAEYQQRIAPILKELARQGKALEINAKGCRSWLGQPGPEEWVLRQFRQYGGRLLTTGSDAHAARYCGYGLDRAAALARAAGFDQIALFRRRKPELYSI